MPYIKKKESEEIDNLMMCMAEKEQKAINNGNRWKLFSIFLIIVWIIGELI
tara:strand:- start:1568 stop:1720 length:153 start_codon:yes stop_codon:yes gene_type:complete